MALLLCAQQVTAAAGAAAKLPFTVRKPPAPPPPPPPSPLSWSAGFSSDMVLQATAEQGAAVYGVALHTHAEVTLTVQGASGAPYHVLATTTPAAAGGATWRAVLKPTAASHAEFTISASCSNCAPAEAFEIVLQRVVFGSVYFCSGRVAAPPALPHPSAESIFELSFSKPLPLREDTGTAWHRLKQHAV